MFVNCSLGSKKFYNHLFNNKQYMTIFHRIDTWYEIVQYLKLCLQPKHQLSNML